MNSLGSKIQSTLIGSISIVTVCALVVLFVNQLNSFANDRIISMMTTEYNIISMSEKLGQEYYNIVRNPGNAQIVSEYQSTRKDLLTVLTTLEKNITEKESKILLLGIKNTVYTIINECDKGIKEMQENNFQNSSGYYAQANKNNEFVRENTRTLLQKELEYLSQTQENSHKFYVASFISTISLFILIVFIMLLFARSFTMQLISPLQRLSLFAKDVADGNFQTQTKQKLQITNDELGSLTQSIYTMVDKLVAMLNNEQRTSEEIKVTSQKLAENNQELQKMNKLMIGREMKMIELKNKIQELEASQHSATGGSS